MEIKFDVGAILQQAVDGAMNEMLFSMMAVTYEKTERMLRKFFKELNSRGVSTQTIIECLAEAAKE